MLFPKATAMLRQTDKIIDALINGDGYYIVRDAIPPEDVQYALKFVKRGTNHYCDKVVERRLWKLHEKSERFAKISQHPVAVDAFNVILGTKHKLANFGANRLMPGAPAQEPHNDYPYWGLFDKSSLPLGINSSFTLACQMLVALQNFTEENGATEVVPGTQKLCAYPDLDRFVARGIKLDLRAGDMVLYHSLLWHRGGNNTSTEDRTVLLGQYTAYFVKDMM